MTAKEKSKAIQKYCDTHGCNDTCPLWDKVDDDEHCYILDNLLPCDIDRNYSILVSAGLIKPNGEVDRKNDEIEFVKVEHEEAEQTIKDSGNRREFSTGAVRDMAEGKGRCDLMPLDVVSEYLEYNNETASRIVNWIYRFQLSKEAKCLFIALDLFVDQHSWSAPDMLLELSKHFEEGAKKYGENNWQKGLPVNCYIDSAVRHYLKWLRGDKDEPHDRAFVWNIMCCIWTVKHKEGKE